jgi:hypothetical protein
MSRKFRENVEPLKSLTEVLERDEGWKFFGNRSLEQHHGLISEYVLHQGVPDVVVQHYENARNAWLYSFFSYRLLQVAILQVHLAGEVAIKERAIVEGVNVKGKTLAKLLEMALKNRWLLDARFEAVTDRAEREWQHLEMLRFIGVQREPFVGPLHEQDYAEGLVDAFRCIRNALAHGEVILKPNLSWEFMAIRDLINQLFPKPCS